MSHPPCSTYQQNAVGTFTCPGVDCCPRAQRPVWGDAEELVFTADSAPCRAGRFAGVVSESGGTFTLNPSPGRESYLGGTRNGITIESWRRYPLSFTVSTGAPAVASSTSSSSSTVVMTCVQYRNDSCSGTYRCPGKDSCPKSGRPVWGVKEGDQCVFTGDSSVCASAIAAGVITAEGGTFTLTPVGPRQSLTGFVEHDVRVRSWSSYSACFVVSPADSAGASGMRRHGSSANEAHKTKKAVSSALTKKPNNRLFFAFENDPIVG